MPGAIDIEPDDDTQLVQGVVLRKNKILGTNGAYGGVSVVLTAKRELNGIGPLLIEQNTIHDTRFGVALLWQNRPSNSRAVPIDITVRNNRICNTANPVVVEGIQPHAVIGNTPRSKRC
jgi:hypothetical protein